MLAMGVRRHHIQTVEISKNTATAIPKGFVLRINRSGTMAENGMVKQNACNNNDTAIYKVLQCVHEVTTRVSHTWFMQ